MEGSVAIIGGTGLSRLPASFEVERLRVETRFGPASALRTTGPNGAAVVFLPRHGESHGIPPHRINYRANIAALSQLGISRILATNAVGSLRLDLPPGSLVLLDDFIDFTRSRPLSYIDDSIESPESVVHTDFTDPYCPELRRIVEESAANLDIALLPRGTYLCADGPRYESPAEVRLFGQWGADVVGMTGLPEAVFAREAGLCYAAVAIVTNFGAGLSGEPLAHGDVERMMAENVQTVRDLLLAAAAAAPNERGCRCGVLPHA